MKKFFCLLLCLIMVFSMCSCVNFYSFTTHGVFESENPKIRLYLGVDATSSGFGHYGEWEQENGDIIKICYASSHGQFRIYEFNEEEIYSSSITTKFFAGKVRPKNENTLVLKADDGTTIVLKKVAELPPEAPGNQGTVNSVS